MAGNHTSYKEWGSICRQKKAGTFQLTEHTPWVIRIQVAAKVGSPGGSDREESACSVGNLDLIPGIGRSPGEGNKTHSNIFA